MNGFKILIATLAVLLMSFQGFKYDVDKDIEQFYVETIVDLKDRNFDFPDTKGVRIVFIEKMNPKQHRDGVAYTAAQNGFITISIFRDHWDELTFVEQQWVVTHEMLAHGFGLGHSNDPRSVLFYDIPNDPSMYDYYKGLEIALKEKKTTGKL